MATATTLLQQPTLADAYTALYSILKDMYWEASTIEAKDEVHGLLEEVGDIVTEINREGLTSDTAIFQSLQPSIAIANAALERIQAKVNQITKNLATAAAAINAISKVLSLIPKP